MSNLRSIGQALKTAAFADSVAAVRKTPRNLTQTVLASAEALAGVGARSRKVSIGNAKLKTEKVEFSKKKRRNGTTERLMSFGNTECVLSDIDWISVLAVCQGKQPKTVFCGCYSAALDSNAGLLRIRCSTTSTYGEIAQTAVCKLA